MNKTEVACYAGYACNACTACCFECDKFQCGDPLCSGCLFIQDVAVDYLGGIDEARDFYMWDCEFYCGVKK